MGKGALAARRDCKAVQYKTAYLVAGACHHNLAMEVPEWSSEARPEVYPEGVKFRRGRSKASLAQPPGAASRLRRAVLADSTVI